MTATITCTVKAPASRGCTPCGKTAVYVEASRVHPGTVFGECAEHAAEFGSMARTAHMVGKTFFGVDVGDTVEVHRYGKTYHATVTRVGARGAVYAEFTYGNGARREVRV